MKIFSPFVKLWKKLESRFPTAAEFIRYWMVANVTTVIDYVVTLLLLWVVFAPWQQVPFQWSIGSFTLIRYDAGRGMGLAGFLAYVISCLLSQIFSFFAQRKYAFRSNNNVWFSAAAFTAATLIVLLITQFLPQFYMSWLYGIVGSEFGSVLIKFFNCCIALWVMYPVNKHLIMKHTEQQASP